jgi:hypothetical protein
MKRMLLCLIALNAPAAVLAAQAPSFAGTWQLQYPRGTRVENGEATVMWGTGTLSVVAQGDSLIGTLTGDPAPDMPPRPPVRLAGKAATRETTFISSSEATLNMNGDTKTATVVSTWNLTVKGDSLVGTVHRKLQGYDMGEDQPAQAVTGVRKQS